MALFGSVWTKRHFNISDGIMINICVSADVIGQL